jgi:peptidoglycan hydrolase-like protein with peptidoglycan-binding domain
MFPRSWLIPPFSNLTVNVFMTSTLPVTDRNQWAAGAGPDAKERNHDEVLWHGSAFNPHGIDGSIGIRTRQALAAFQKARGIAVTSKLDSATVDELAKAWPF